VENTDGTPAIWLMGGLALLDAFVVGPGNPGPSWQIKGAADFDRDGDADILWQNTNGTPAIWVMDGPNFEFPLIAGPNPGPSWQIKGTADFDRDGDADILWQNTNGTPAIWVMEGSQLVFPAVLGRAIRGRVGRSRTLAISMAMATPTFCGRTPMARPRREGRYE
jgi:serralysin